MGYEKTAAQCKERMKTLKKSYRTCRDTLKKSGESRKLCKFYKELNEVLETRPATSPMKVIQNLQTQQATSDTEASDVDIVDDHFDDNVTEVEHDGQEDDEDLPETGRQNEKQQDEGETDKLSVNETKNATKKQQKGKQRKSRLQTSLETVMDKFTKSNEAIEASQIELEKARIELDMKRLDEEGEKREFELKKLDREEKQKSADRDHQLRMLELIMNTRPPFPVAAPIITGQPIIRPPFDPVYGTLQHAAASTSSGATANDNPDYTDTERVPIRGLRRSSGSFTQSDDGHSYYNM